LIQDENRLKKLQELANVRDPLYAELADLTFPARNGSVDKTVELICQALQAHQSGKHSDNNEAQTQSNE
jgi:shikimate kinase